MALQVQSCPRGVRIICGDTVVAERPTCDSDLRPIVQAWLRARARRELPPLLLALAGAHGLTVPRVSVRDQRSRWGACSPTGTITLNWRLIQAPPFVREYVLLHELMHRRELNHSRRFWKLVVACCPRHAEARQWLRKEGKSLWSDSE
jgi:predicted metal-dependent hydrolase